MKQFFGVVTFVAFLISAGLSFADEPETPTWTAEVAGSLQAGQEGTVTLTIRPADGYKWNTAYPAKLLLENGNIVTFEKQEFRKSRGDITGDDSHGEVRMTATGARAGAETITSTLKFSICNEQSCKLLTEEIPLPVTVQ